MTTILKISINGLLKKLQIKKLQIKIYLRVKTKTSKKSIKTTKNHKNG
jgi:hypothetical protein